MHKRECGATVPLARQTWLCRKDGRAVAMKPVKDRASKSMRFEIVSASSEAALGFDPADHSDRGDAECPFCGATIDADRVKTYGTSGRIGFQLMAVVTLVPGERGRAYLPAESVPIPRDAEVARRLAEFGEAWPGPAATKLPEDARAFWIYLYGLDTYDKLFTNRQALALLTFCKKLYDAREGHPFRRRRPRASNGGNHIRCPCDRQTCGQLELALPLGSIRSDH